jgi:endonuclease-3
VVKPHGRESPKQRAARAQTVLTGLRREYPQAECALLHRDPLQLLVATILSAQCTDERVNMVTPPLFHKYPDAKAFADADFAELGEVIHSTGFFNAKARHIIGTCKAIIERHAGEVPRTLDALVALPGVGRKTASVVLGVAWGLVEGVVVDTHVYRLTRRLGLSRGNSPEAVERDLMALLPQGDWIEWSDRLIWHGRRVCNARRPRCSACFAEGICPQVGVTRRAQV